MEATSFDVGEYVKFNEDYKKKYKIDSFYTIGKIIRTGKVHGLEKAVCVIQWGSLNRDGCFRPASDKYNSGVNITSELSDKLEKVYIEPLFHRWFGLSYTSYLVLSRLALEHMPNEWQKKFMDLIDQIPEKARKNLYQINCIDQKTKKFKKDPWRDYRRDHDGVAKTVKWPR